MPMQEFIERLLTYAMRSKAWEDFEDDEAAAPAQ